MSEQTGLRRQFDAADAEARPISDRETVAAVTGLFAAVGASSCCIVPLILFALGISGAWIGNLTALEPYQPFFIAVAIGCLGYGYYRVYRRSRSCDAAGACTRKLPTRLIQSALLAATALVAAALAFPLVAPALLGV